MVPPNTIYASLVIRSKLYCIWEIINEVISYNSSNTFKQAIFMSAIACPYMYIYIRINGLSLLKIVLDPPMVG